jgi:hypothetical protein
MTITNQFISKHDDWKKLYDEDSMFRYICTVLDSNPDVEEIIRMFYVVCESRKYLLDNIAEDI